MKFIWKLKCFLIGFIYLFIFILVSFIYSWFFKDNILKFFQLFYNDNNELFGKVFFLLLLILFFGFDCFGEFVFL